MTIRKARGQDPLAFTPVPRRLARKDGWTPRRQKQFIAALAVTGNVQAAALQCGMAKEGAYALRNAPGGDSFARAWDAAVGKGIGRLADIAMERAIDGVPVPIMHAGKQVGERRQFDNRLLTFMLRHHRPDEFGANPGVNPGTMSERGRLARFFQGEEVSAAQVKEVRGNIRRKLLVARHSYQRSIMNDPARCAAWDLLCGPADWPAIRSDRYPRRENPMPMDNPATVIPIATGYMPELTEEAQGAASDRITQLLSSIARNNPAWGAADAGDLDLAEARKLFLEQCAAAGIDVDELEESLRPADPAPDAQGANPEDTDAPRSDWDDDDNAEDQE